MDWSDGTTVSGEGREEDGWEPRVETCRIVLWRGYRTSAFYARPDDDAPGTSIGAPSTSFRRRGPDAPDTAEARLAHQELVSRLEANGWVPTGRGDEWYEAEFARTILVPSRRTVEIAEESEPEQEQAVPEARMPPPLVPRSAAVVREPSPRRHLDRWRVAAATGLAVAIALVGWFATHPSSLRAASSACPSSMLARAPRQGVTR